MINVAIGPCLQEVLFTGKASEGHRKLIEIVAENITLIMGLAEESDWFER